jgi:transcriptional regulator with XRE-family HTH domain
MEYFTKSVQRLAYFIETKGLSLNKLSMQIGVSNSYFSKMVRNNASIGSDILEKILRAFPDLNAEWLLTGAGEMTNDLLKVGEIDQSLLIVKKDELPPGPCRQCEVKDMMIAALQDTVEALKEANRLLKARETRESEG